MLNDEKNQNTQSIWVWKNTSHISKAALQASFAIAAIAIAATTIYAAAKGVAPSSALPAFLANPWVIAAIASYVAIYFVARSISSYQQLYSMEGANGRNGHPGQKDEYANFSVLLGDAIIKSGTISVEKSGQPEKKVEELFLALPIDDYKALAEDDEKMVHVLLAGKEVELKHKDPSMCAKEYKVKIINVNKKTQLDEMKAELGMAKEANSLKVAVSNKDYQALKCDVPAKLQEVAVNAAITKATGK
ncbi:hypothetical protein [Wolbachia endosymbiont of Tettigetta isshikii]|uniref:hypothetical protein n=1 Tax=Wolbachia endosymbiont of Tettigetta isshikii TaxID=3239093 RepID=UPI0039805868